MKDAVQRTVIQLTKLDDEKGRWLLDGGDFGLPDGFNVVQSAIVGFKPNGWAANHHHQRQEVLLGLTGELYLIWRDREGQRHEERMIPDDGTLRLFVIAPHVPHLVENRSSTTEGILHEWSDRIDESIPLEGSESLRNES